MVASKASGRKGDMIPMNRFNEREARAGALIPKGPIAQSRWKWVVCFLYGLGHSIRNAMAYATELEREADDAFQARYDPRLLGLS